MKCVVGHRRAAVLAWVLGVALVLLHLDWWRPQRPVVYLGWIPEELLWRLGWMALAALYLVWFCARVWRVPGGGRGPGGED